MATLSRYQPVDGPRIGSLCSGFGGLDLAVLAVLAGQVVWHAENDPDASRVLDRRWPGVPNHGDITSVDWTAVEPVDVLVAGFPCQDVSSAGKGAGIQAGNRSGLWLHVAEAIKVLRPNLVVVENVEGILSAQADRGVGPSDTHVEEAGAHALRALGCVLGDLADLGFDARWCRLGAADVGAPHRRNRVFVVAYPAGVGHGDGRAQGGGGLPAAVVGGVVADADSERIDGERVSGPGGWSEPADGAATDAEPPRTPTTGSPRRLGWLGRSGTRVSMARPG